jgi:hypothetical protein
VRGNTKVCFLQAGNALKKMTNFAVFNLLTVKLALILFAILCFLAFSGQQCRRSTSSRMIDTPRLNHYQKVPPGLFQRWFNSFEEDVDTVKVYRPEGFDFPLARGRTGFSFLPEGKFEQYDIAPTDGLEKTMGTWQMESNEMVRVQLSNVRAGKTATYRFRIIFLNKGLLKVQFL